ncbi:hypothetical protein HMI55_001287, partial [Coelomomyces lativittatus]
MTLLKKFYLVAELLVVSLIFLNTTYTSTESPEEIRFTINNKHFNLFKRFEGKKVKPWETIELDNLSKFNVSVNVRDFPLTMCQSRIILKNVKEGYLVFDLTFTKIIHSFSADVYFVTEKSPFINPQNSMNFFMQCKIKSVKNSFYSNRIPFKIKKLEKPLPFEEWEDLMKNETLERPSFAIVPGYAFQGESDKKTLLNGMWVEDSFKKYVFFSYYPEILKDRLILNYDPSNLNRTEFIKLGKNTLIKLSHEVNDGVVVDEQVVELDEFDAEDFPLIAFVPFLFPDSFLYPFQSCSAYLEPKDGSLLNYMLFKCFSLYCSNTIELFFVEELMDLNSIENHFFAQSFVFHLKCEIHSNIEKINLKTHFKANLKFKKPEENWDVDEILITQQLLKEL